MIKEEVKYVSTEEVHKSYKEELQKKLDVCPKMVRGVVAASFSRSGFLAKPDPCQPNFSYDTVVAYTPWRRHDDPLEYVIQERDALCDTLSKMKGFSGALLDFEFRLYKDAEETMTEWEKEHPIY